MTQLMIALERRVSLPDDSEPMRRQKLIAICAGFSAVLSTALMTTTFFVTGLTALGWLHLTYGLAFAILLAIALLTPRRYVSATIGIGIISLIVNLVAHGLSGGYSGGVWFLGWLIMNPLNMFLAGGARAGIPLFILCMAGFIAAAVFEPVFATANIVITGGVRVLVNTLVLIAISSLGCIWAFYFVRELDAARARADDLLLNILPAPIARRLKRDTSTIADGYDEATVLFADIVNFTTLSADADPVDVVAFLNAIFSDFDDLAQKHGLEKIKTIGDAYMVAGGLPAPRPDHCQAVVAFALDMLAAVQRHRAWHGEPVQLRVGVNTGPVVAGVIGRHKFIYDLWGDAVNTASRMESNGLAGVVVVTAAVRDRLVGKYTFEERPAMMIKGKGEMVTYVLRP